MTKLVTLTRDLRPWRQGDRVPLPDELAHTLIETGEAKDMGNFPEGSPDSQPTLAERVRNIVTGPPKGHYRTKGVPPS